MKDGSTQNECSLYETIYNCHTGTVQPQTFVEKTFCLFCQWQHVTEIKFKVVWS